MKRSAYLAVAVASVALAVAGCSSSGNGSGGSSAAGTTSQPVTTPTSGTASTSTGGTLNGTLTIPMVAEMSGAFSIVGGPSLAGAQTAAYEINKAGGIFGKKVEIKVYDGQSDPTAEGQAIRQIIATKPIAMTASTVSTAFVPSIPALSSAKIPMVVPGPFVAGDDKLTWYTTWVGDTQVAEGPIAVAKAALGSLSGKKVALETLANSGPGDTWVNLSKQQLTAAGATVVGTYRPATPVVSFTNEAAQVVSSGAQVFLADEQDPNLVVINKALAAAGYKGIEVNSTAGSDDSVLTTVPQVKVYVTRDTSTVTKGDPLYQAAQAAGANMSQVLVNDFFAKEYGAVWILADVLNKCGSSCTNTQFASTIKSLGPIDIPLQPFLGKPDFSSGGYSGINFAQGYGLNDAKNGSKSITPLLTLAS